MRIKRFLIGVSPILLVVTGTLSCVTQPCSNSRGCCPRKPFDDFAATRRVKALLRGASDLTDFLKPFFGLTLACVGLNGS